MKNAKPGDIYYNDYIGFHITIIESMSIDDRWWSVFVLETAEYNYYLDEDFESHSGWEKIA